MNGVALECRDQLILETLGKQDDLLGLVCAGQSFTLAARPTMAGLEELGPTAAEGHCHWASETACLAALVISPLTCIGGLRCAWQEPIGALLEGLCTMDAAAREALYQAPEGEMMAILDVLEPVG